MRYHRVLVDLSRPLQVSRRAERNQPPQFPGWDLPRRCGSLHPQAPCSGQGRAAETPAAGCQPM